MFSRAFLFAGSLCLFAAAPALAGIKMIPPEQADNMGSDCSSGQGDKILTWNGADPTKCYKNVTIESSALVIGTASGGTLLSINPQDAANEGAQIVMKGAGAYDWWYPDVYQNHFRLYSSSTHNNQVQIFNNGAGTTDLYVEGKVGIGTTAPTQSLDVTGNTVVSGSVKVGNDTETCDGTKSGAIRWTGSAMQYCNGSAWTAFGGSPECRVCYASTFDGPTCGTKYVYSSEMIRHYCPSDYPKLLSGSCWRRSSGVYIGNQNMDDGNSYLCRIEGGGGVKTYITCCK